MFQYLNEKITSMINLKKQILIKCIPKMQENIQFWTDSALLEIYISAARVPQINKYNRIEKYDGMLKFQSI